jgi:hypothetical protein
MVKRVFSETPPVVVVACGALRPSEPDLIFETLLTLLPITPIGNGAEDEGKPHMEVDPLGTPHDFCISRSSLACTEASACC